MSFVRDIITHGPYRYEIFNPHIWRVGRRRRRRRRRRHHHHHKHQGLDLWSVPSPHLQLLAPSLLRSSNCSSSLLNLVVWFQRYSVLWHSLQVWKPFPSVFIYLCGVYDAILSMLPTLLLWCTTSSETFPVLSIWTMLGGHEGTCWLSRHCSVTREIHIPRTRNGCLDKGS